MKVFFDVDGVLIDGWHADPARRQPWDAEIERDLGISRTALQAALFAPASDGSASPMIDCVGGRRDLKDVLANLLPTIGYSGSVDSFVDYWFEKDSHVNAAVLDVVTRLAREAGAGVYLATGQERYRASYLWNDLGFKEHFDDLFYSAESGKLKSDPAFYAQINAVLNIEPMERPLFFDDSASSVAAARKAGWDACLFATVDDLHTHPRVRALLD